MAVPKKRTSKSKKNSRRANWKQQAAKEARKALSLAQSVLTGKSHSFVFLTNNKPSKNTSETE
uniref:ribosomal protein L32 n=1 Tax=Streptofilum capillatum TaxID=2058781 RepID=UPI00286C3FCB|nr:ribosomal protein L32 [Streptofilum capillatum]WKT08583.1 ribosomal protein L32 [Streptofilum capillatum]WKT08682.1 ribosomal protein L32 [Streptofilum sp. BC4-VF8pt]WKT08781.1 ribosomal protein L32 [Streptofilum sp. ZNP2-VF4pt]